MKRREFPPLLAAATLIAACSSPPNRTLEPPYDLVEGEPMYTVLPEDAIPSVDEPTFLPAADAEAMMDPSEPVLGVVGRDGTIKAYSAWQLEGHEIVNDEIDGLPIAVTW